MNTKRDPVPVRCPLCGRYWERVWKGEDGFGPCKTKECAGVLRRHVPHRRLATKR